MSTKNWGRNVREALARSESDFLASDELEQPTQRGIEMLRLFLRHPLEVAGVCLMAALGMSIIINALFMQDADLSPFLAQHSATQEQPAPAPVEQTRSAPVQDAADTVRDIQSALAERNYYSGPADGVHGPKTTAAIRAFQQQNGLEADGRSSPQLLAQIIASPSRISQETQTAAGDAAMRDPIADLINGNSPSAVEQLDRRMLNVEKALADQGYGPLRIDGVMSSDTRAAIIRFEKDRGLPVTGQLSERLIRELAIVSGKRRL